MEENRTEKQDVTEAAVTETEIRETAAETENKTEQVSETAAPEKPETEPAEKGKTAKKSGPVKKWIKICLKVLLGIVLFLVIAISCFLLFLDSIMKGIIEGYGPEYAGVIFEIEDIDVQLLKGRIEIKNLCMYNPEGYKTDYAVKLGDVAFDTKISSWFFGNKTIIRELRLKDITVNYEFDTKWENGEIKHTSNLHQIVDNVKAKLEQQKAQLQVASIQADPEIKLMLATAGPAAAPQPAPQPEDDSRRFRLDKLVLENIKVNVQHKRFAEINLKALDFTLQEKLGPYGVDGKGLTGLEIAAKAAPDVLIALVQSVSLTAGDLIQRYTQKQDEIKKDVKAYTKRAENLDEQWEEDPAKAIQAGAELFKDVMENENMKEGGAILKGMFEGIFQENKN